MHFALPPRKTSHPPPYARGPSNSISSLRRRQLQLLSYVVLGALTIYLLFHYLSSNTSEVLDNGIIKENPEVVIVTVFDEKTMNKDYIRLVKANRDDYARRHGYKNFYTNTTTYANILDTAPSSWSIVPSLRHTLKLYPTADYIWSLTADALITTPSLSLSTHIFTPLESLMLKDLPVVPPDSVIHTFSHLKPSHAHLIISQDRDNLSPTSLILRNTAITDTNNDNWAHYFLDVWFDPLYRLYAFQKAELHALEHIVQWHPTILAKLVLIPQRRFNSYNFASPSVVADRTGIRSTPDSMWQQGDFIINLKGCRDSKERDCEKEMKQYFHKWKKEVSKLDGQTPKLDTDLSTYIGDDGAEGSVKQHADPNVEVIVEEVVVEKPMKKTGEKKPDKDEGQPKKEEKPIEKSEKKAEKEEKKQEEVKEKPVKKPQKQQKKDDEDGDQEEKSPKKKAAKEEEDNDDDNE